MRTNAARAKIVRRVAMATARPLAIARVVSMIAAAGNHVDQLHRYAVGGLSLEDGSLPELASEDWCYLRPKHLALLGYAP